MAVDAVNRDLGDLCNLVEVLATHTRGLEHGYVAFWMRPAAT